MTAALKHPPHAVEPEQMILGGLLLTPAAAVTVFGMVRPEDFYRQDHQGLARAILLLHEARKPHDSVALADFLRDSGELENCGGVAYINSLASDCFSTANIEHYAGIVRDKAARRRVIALCAEVSEAAYRSDSENLAGMLTAGVENLLRTQGSQSKKFAELVPETVKYLELAKQRRKAGGTIGVPSGIPALDKVLSGFWGGRVYGIAARPGTGKTALLNQIAFHATNRGDAGLIHSIEMGSAELIIRAMSAYSKKNVGRMFHGYEEECDIAISTARKMGDIPLWIDEQTSSLNQILASIAVHKQRHGIKWAAIDHVGLIQTEKFNSRNDQIGHITWGIKQAAKRLNIPIIALFQLSRMSEKENRRPGLHDLRDSGNIEQDLDVALFLHVDQTDRDKPVKPVAIGNLKDRSGRVGWLDSSKDARFEFDGAVQTFREVASGYEPPRSYHEVEL